MPTNTNASIESIGDLRRRLRAAFVSRGELLLNVIDALTVGPRAATPIELAASPVWGFAFSSLYSGLNGAEHLADARLRLARIAWLTQWGTQMIDADERLGRWDVHILDATNVSRPRTRTLRLGFAHGADGMRPGHAFSLLARRVGEGSWTLPLEVALIPVEQTPRAFGAQHIVDFIADHGWRPDQVLTVDADYTNEPTLRPMLEAGANILGRVSSRRVFYLPPEPYAGFGRPRVRGRKFKLSDARTLPEASSSERIEFDTNRAFAISRWDDVRMRQWPTQPVTLYRVIEYRADGSPRYHRPLWLIYVGQSAAPSPAHGQAIYSHRFDVEHTIRFLKVELSFDAARFHSPGAEDRIQLWVELVATAMWMLYAMRPLAHQRALEWPRWWRGRRLTPGAMRRLAAGLFLTLAITAPKPKVRGKSHGRAMGTRLEPKKRHRIYRKRKGRAAA